MSQWQHDHVWRPSLSPSDHWASRKHWQWHYPQIVGVTVKILTITTPTADKREPSAVAFASKLYIALHNVSMCYMICSKNVEWEKNINIIRRCVSFKDKKAENGKNTFMLWLRLETLIIIFGHQSEFLVTEKSIEFKLSANTKVMWFNHWTI